MKQELQSFENGELENILNDLSDAGWIAEDFKGKNKFIKECKKLTFTLPQKGDVFNAFKIGENDSIITPEEVKVLIIGQDPYPKIKKENDKIICRADGLAFSFGNGDPAEDSLLHIFEAVECYREKYGIKPNEIDKRHTSLKIWARTNKILLLNTALTYKDSEKSNHQGAWNPFINEIIKTLLTHGDNKRDDNNKLVIFLWGDDAKKIFHNVIYNENENKKIDLTKNIKRNLLVLTTSHPTQNHNAYKKGFCYEAPNHFEACNKFLEMDIWKNFPEK